LPWSLIRWGVFDSLLLTTLTSQANQANSYVATLLPRYSLLSAPCIKFSYAA
jgi:hypothetical protein